MTSTKAGKGSSMATTFSRICVRRDTAKNWHDPSIAKLPLQGEICLTVKGDGGDEDKQYAHEWGQFKIGDGQNEWADIEYYAGGGDTEVIVSDDDPALTWPGNGVVPNGTLWFDTKGGKDTLLIRVNASSTGEWKQIAPDNELTWCTSDTKPIAPIHGDLAYLSDEGLLKVWDKDAGTGGDWIPACAPVNDKDDAVNMVRRTGDDMSGALQVSDISKTTGEPVFKVLTNDGDPGGFQVTGDGKISAIGGSEAINEGAQLTTKDYVDKEIGLSVGGKYVSSVTNGDQEIHSVLYLKPVNPNSPLSKARNTTKESEVRNDRLKSPNLTIGNGAKQDKNGNDFPAGPSHWTSIKKLQHTYADDLEETPFIEQTIYDRCTEVAYISSVVRAGSTEDGVEIGKPDNYPKNMVYDTIQWNDNAIPDDKLVQGTPERYINWLVDPEDSSWGTGYHSDDKSPPEQRAANKGYVDKAIQQRIIGKGSDLCAGAEDDAQVGGFWRDSDSGIIYLKMA